ncbi:MAG: hypothetical protein ACRD3C_22570 [Vicinamibacterales bacterium]
MRRLIALLVGAVLCASTSPVFAQAQARSYEAITVSTTAVGISAGVLQQSTSGQATVCALSVEGAEIRYRFDGVAPTATEGHRIPASTTLPLSGFANLSSLRMIRESGSDATVRVTCMFGTGEVESPLGIAGGGGGAGGAGVDPVRIHDGTDTLLITAGGAALVDCPTCSGSGVQHIDNAAFTKGTDDVVPAGVLFDDTAPGALTEDRVGAMRGSVNRNGYIQIRDGANNERGANVTANNELLVELGAGAASIGTLGANSGVDIGDVDVTSIVPGTGATNLGKLEDAIHVSGDVGVMALAVYNGAGTALAADGDYTPLQTDASGNLRVTTAPPPVQYAEDSIHASGDTINLMGVVVNDTPDAMAAEGDRSVLITDAEGRLHAAVLIVDSAGAALAFAQDVVEDVAHATGVSGPAHLSRRIDTNGSSADTSGDYATVNQDENGSAYMTPQATNSGGATPVPYISAGATEDEHAVCTAACTLYSITVTNANASPRYLKCENDTAAGTAPGTDTPEFRMLVPATGGGTIAYAVGLHFSTALTCWLVTGQADSDVAEVAANELMVNYGIKQ